MTGWVTYLRNQNRLQWVAIFIVFMAVTVESHRTDRSNAIGKAYDEINLIKKEIKENSEYFDSRIGDLEDKVYSKKKGWFK